MDILTRADLDQLGRRDESGVHLSLFLPTHRLASEDRTDPLRWKNLLASTEVSLAEQGLRRTEIADLLAPAWALHADALAWQFMSDGLAMFLRTGWHRTYRVPARLPELVTVGERFVTGPLLPVLAHDDHFLVLALSQRNVRLFEGSRHRLEELELREVPTDLRDIIEEPEPRSNTMARPLSAGRGGGRAVFYGHGAADEDFKKDEVQQFLSLVAGGVGEYLAGRHVPMVLVGLAETVAMYRSVGGYPHVLDEEVRTNPDGLAVERVHELAWPVFETTLDRRRAAALDRLGALLGKGQAVTAPAEVADAAGQGRVQTLFVAADPWCWERVSGDGSVFRLGSEETFTECEQLDTAITGTLAHGGEVYAVPAAEVSGGSSAAALLRY